MKVWSSFWPQTTDSILAFCRTLLACSATRWQMWNQCHLHNYKGILPHIRSRSCSLRPSKAYSTSAFKNVYLRPILPELWRNVLIHIDWKNLSRILEKHWMTLLLMPSHPLYLMNSVTGDYMADLGRSIFLHSSPWICLNAVDLPHQKQALQLF